MSVILDGTHCIHALAEVFVQWSPYGWNYSGTQNCQWFGGLYICFYKIIVLICGIPIVAWQYQSLWLVVLIYTSVTLCYSLYSTACLEVYKQ